MRAGFQIAPLRNGGDHDPRGLAQRSGQVDRSRAHRDDQIEARDQSRNAVHRGVRLRPFVQHDAVTHAQIGDFSADRAVLQGNKMRTRQPQ